MDLTLLLVVVVILIALAFDYINGFHDAANSIATVVATRVLTPGTGRSWAAFFNLLRHSHSEPKSRRRSYPA